MASPARIVMDTNVLYAGLYSTKGASYRLLRRIEEGKVTPVLSTALVFEYEEVLRREAGILGLSDQQIDDALDELCLRGEPRPVFFLWRPQLPDPKDDHVLELAVAADSPTIVTHNTRHFRKAEPFGVPVLTPKQFLETLR